MPEKIVIELANLNDIPRLIEIYQKAKGFMRKTGNLYQWGEGYPDSFDLLAKDIENNHLYVVKENGVVHGVFAFILGEDPTYQIIEGGEWLSFAPYGTIHRIASDGTIHRMMDKAVSFCWEKIPHLRVDTHPDNKVMREAILRNGFVYRGIIYLKNGEQRLAFEKI